jgi:hypothetical protein
MSSNPRNFRNPLDPAQLAEGGNFLLTTRFGRLDILQWVPGLGEDGAFGWLKRGAERTELGGAVVYVCSRDDLIMMKRHAGRQRDLDDLRELGVD